LIQDSLPGAARLIGRSTGILASLRNPSSDLGSWQRYADPFVLAAGSNIRFRAVDVNGNIEATHELTA